jgi:uncharacterized protein (DUF433 family)
MKIASEQVFDASHLSLSYEAIAITGKYIWVTLHNRSENQPQQFNKQFSIINKQAVICYTTPTMATKQQHYQDRIIRTPGFVGGKPVVRGTRIPVRLVLEYLAEDPDVKTLFEAFPHLTREDVKACLDYARDLVEEEEIFPLPEQTGHPSQAHL